MRRMTETGDTRYKKIMAVDGRRSTITEQEERSSLHFSALEKDQIDKSPQPH